MKIEIQNLGPIHHFEFDLAKDLHLLYGENNVGKSFAVNVVYCILEAFLEEGEWLSHLDYSKYNAYWEHLFNTMKDTQEYQKLNAAIVSKIKSSPSKKAPIKEEVRGMLYFFLNQTLVNIINTSFSQTYSSNLTNYLTDETPKVNIYSTFFKLSLNYKADSGFYVSELIHQDIDVYTFEGYQSEKGFGYFRGGVGPNDKITEDRLGFVISTWIYNYIAKSPERGDVSILPSSRSGLNVLLNRVGYSIIQGPIFPKPILDYFDNIKSINPSKKDDTFDVIVKRVEKILNGKIDIESVSKKIIYTPNKSAENIPVENAASMVSELAPFVLYLFFVINRRPLRRSDKPPLLIIEEPEAHLHPKVQVQLMEIFAELTKHNVKVILTSHSNYMFNKLSNMLLKKEIEPEKVAVYHMVMEDNGSIVKKDMQATTEGIEDHNFADVARKLYQERLESYDVLNEDPDAD